MAWDDAKRQKAVTMYEESEPTPENSLEIIKEIAEELEESPNGVRMILTKAGVYVKKAAAATAKPATSTGTRVSKSAAVDALKAAILDAGQEVDEDVVSKLTGKAAVYFTDIINAVNN